MLTERSEDWAEALGKQNHVDRAERDDTRFDRRDRQNGGAETVGKTRLQRNTHPKQDRGAATRSSPVVGSSRTSSLAFAPEPGEQDGLDSLACGRVL
jgi:hypothetical protein